MGPPPSSFFSDFFFPSLANPNPNPVLPALGIAEEEGKAAPNFSGSVDVDVESRVGGCADGVIIVVGCRRSFVDGAEGVEGNEEGGAWVGGMNGDDEFFCEGLDDDCEG